MIMELILKINNPSKLNAILAFTKRLGIKSEIKKNEWDISTNSLIEKYPKYKKHLLTAKDNIGQGKGIHISNDDLSDFESFRKAIQEKKEYV